jgi:tetratricopeptide (TPR) repeat protein
VLERSGEPPAWAACLREAAAALALREGRLPDAERQAALAVELSARAYGGDALHTVQALELHGLVLTELSRHEDALAVRVRQLAAVERRKGDAALAHRRVAESLLALGRRDEALRHADAALARAYAPVGEQQLDDALARCVRGVIRSDLAEVEAGLEALRARGADSRALAQALIARAAVLEGSGRHTEAEASRREASAAVDRSP